jgi:hypothetical protein
MTDDVISPPIQTEDHVEEATPKSQIASTVADLPSDFGAPGLVDFPDPAWDDIYAVNDDDGGEDSEVPGEGEPEPDESDEEGPLEDDDEPPEEEDPDESDPVVPPGIKEDQQPDSEFDHDPEGVED